MSAKASSGPDSALRRHVFDGLRRLAEAGTDEVGARLEQFFAPDCGWRVAHPINEMAGTQAALSRIWHPLMTALPDLERRDTIFVAGHHDGRDYIAATGHYCGTFHRDWLGIPATGQAIYLRYGEIYEISEGRIVQANLLWDVLDFVRQAGLWPLAPGMGQEGMWPSPITQDGLMMTPGEPRQSAASIAQTLAMQAALGAYDDTEGRGREGLLTMPQKEFWHPRMMWYGPSGIGTTRGLAGFVDWHQMPFRKAFPKGGDLRERLAAERTRLGGGHYIRIGDGPYSVTGGWPSVVALHLGDDFLGVGPSGRTVTMRVMDFYLHDEGLIRENWVPLDILDLLRQMGVDVLGRLRARLGLAAAAPNS